MSTGTPITRIAAYALARDEAGLTLLVRVAPGYPDAGDWTLPGGGLKFGEDPADATLRELTEETGLTGRINSFLFVHSMTGPARPDYGLKEWHAIRIFYRVEITGGELRDETDESTDASAWFSPEEISTLPTVDLVDVALTRLDEAAGE
ncbi:MAG: NUDIX domain-containing protein [Candidatus Limnocylindrales bacterium]